MIHAVPQPRSWRRGHLSLALALLSLLAGCARPGGVGAGRGAPDGSDPRDAATRSVACDPLPGSPSRGGDLVLALAEAVSPQRAPVPATHAERIVFANLYETLTRMTCDGRLEPALATRWDRHEGGRRWRLQLREDAVFWNGDPVTATAVIAAWRRNEQLAQATGRPYPGLWLTAGGQGLAAIDARTLDIRLAEPQEDLPHLLAHPDLAVAFLRPDWTWPLGSGPCRLAADSDLPSPDLVCRPNLHHPDRPTWRSLTFRVTPGRDARDLLAGGVDLAVIRDHGAATYYAQLPDVRSAPLPWDRLYALLIPPGSPLAAASLVAGIDAAATPGESVPRRSFFFTACRPGLCPQLQGPTVGAGTPPSDPDPAVLLLEGRRVLHAVADADARALAERVAAFQPGDFVARGLDGPPLAHSLQAGLSGGYVVRLEASYPTACLELAALLARADWLQQRLGGRIDACRGAALLAADGLAVPLMATRARLIWRGDLAGLDLTHDGAPLVARLGRVAPEPAP